MTVTAHRDSTACWDETWRAATEFVRRGWTVQPGTFWAGNPRAWRGKREVRRLQPLADDWQNARVSEPETALGIWTRAPYSILLACGEVLDGVEVSALHGQRARLELNESGALGPIVDTPFGTWLFLVRSGHALRPELAANCGVHLFSTGSWLALPPTIQAGVPYRWSVPPAAAGWRIPDSREIQEVLVRTAKRPSTGRFRPDGRQQV